jgi:hypothetical protein
METQIESLLNEIEMTTELQPHVTTRLNNHNEAYDWLVGVEDYLVEHINNALYKYYACNFHSLMHPLVNELHSTNDVSTQWFQRKHKYTRNLFKHTW